jgi:hypothetical protein
VGSDVLKSFFYTCVQALTLVPPNFHGQNTVLEFNALPARLKAVFHFIPMAQAAGFRGIYFCKKTEKAFPLKQLPFEMLQPSAPKAEAARKNT